MKNNRTLKPIYKSIAEEFKITIERAEKICDSQFEFLRKTMMEGKDEQVRLQFFGTFLVGENRRANVDKKVENMFRKHRERRKANETE